MDRSGTLLKRKNRTVISGRFATMLSAAVLTVFFSCILSIIDTIIAGITIGEDGVSGVTLISPLTTFIAFIGYTISSGTSLFSGFKQGQGDDSEADEIFSTGLITGIASAIIVTLCLILLKGMIFDDPVNNFGDFKTEALQYYTGLYLYPTALYLNLMMYGFAMAFGRDRMCLHTGILSAVLNIILSVLLAGHYGCYGISIGTSISLFAGTLFYIINLLTHKINLKLKLCFSYRKFKRIIFVGINDSLDMLALGLLPFAVSAYLIRNFGPEHYIIFTVVLNGLNLVSAFLTGLSDTMEALLMLYFGEKNYHALKEIFTISLRTVIVFSTLASLMLFVFAEPFAQLLGINDPGNLGSAVQALRIFSPFLIVISVEYIYLCHYSCIRHEIYSYILLALLFLLAPSFLIYLLGHTYRMIGVWWGMGLSSIICMMINIVCVLIMNRRLGLGKAGRTLLPQSELERQLYYNCPADVSDIVSTVERAADDMKSHALPDNRSARIQLLMEEMGLQAIERNASGSKTARPVYLQYTIMPGEPTVLIIRDNGILANDTDDAENLTKASLHSYVLAQAASGSSTEYKPTTERNRTKFYI